MLSQGLSLTSDMHGLRDLISVANQTSPVLVIWAVQFHEALGGRRAAAMVSPSALDLANYRVTFCIPNECLWCPFIFQPHLLGCRITRVVRGK